MKLIVNNKIYNTENSELLCTFDKRWKIKTQGKADGCEGCEFIKTNER